jgi:hypothetical protein
MRLLWWNWSKIQYLCMLCSVLMRGAGEGKCVSGPCRVISGSIVKEHHVGFLEILEVNTVGWAYGSILLDSLIAVLVSDLLRDGYSEQYSTWSQQQLLN